MKFYEEWSIGPSNEIKKHRLDDVIQMMPARCCTPIHWVHQKRNMRSSTLDHEKALTIISLLVDCTMEEVLMGLTFYD
jgi:hypothetical protein